MNDLELQRLIDGQLDHEDRRQFLLQIDDQPAEWRTVALALLEEQAFQQALGRSPSAHESIVPLPMSAASDLTNKKTEKTATNGAAVQWLSMVLAASLLIGIGFFGGGWLGRFLDGPAAGLATSSNATVAESGAVIGRPSNEYASLKPVGNLSFITDAVSNSNTHAVQVPLYEAEPEHIASVLEKQQEQIQAWNEQLRRRGYELDWRPEMLESRLPDGRSVIVPVQHVRVRSLGQ